MYVCMYVCVAGTVRELDSPTEERVGAIRVERDPLRSPLNGPPLPAGMDWDGLDWAAVSIVRACLRRQNGQLPVHRLISTICQEYLSGIRRYLWRRGYMYVCMYVCMYFQIAIHLGVKFNMYFLSYMYVQCVCMHIYMYIMYVCMYLKFIYVCMYYTTILYTHKM